MSKWHDFSLADGTAWVAKKENFMEVWQAVVESIRHGLHQRSCPSEIMLAAAQMPPVGDTAAADPVEDHLARSIATTLVTVPDFICRHRSLFCRTPVANWVLDLFPSGLRPLVRYCFQLAGVVADRSSDTKLDRQLEHWVGRNGKVSLQDASSGSGPSFEAWLERFEPKTRRQLGVFYTPPSIAQFIVSQIHDRLIDEFHLRRGLADDACWQDVMRSCAEQYELEWGDPEGDPTGDPFVRVFDPTMGCGVFLEATVVKINQVMTQAWREEGCNEAQARQRWQAYVHQLLLPRLFGCELMLAPYILTHLRLTICLQRTGFQFRQPGRMNLFLTNTLEPTSHPQNASQQEQQSRRLKLKVPTTVIVGNPPYQALSTSRGKWIVDLLHGRGEGRAGTLSYYQVDGAPLGERKAWLHDDYVKFLRYIQWKIDSAGCGLVGLVTNHGYLDNVTFRGMRQQLASSFEQIDVIDLHGNLKKKEHAPDGTQDENPFLIETGVCINLLQKRIGASKNRVVRYSELWGSRADKLTRLTSMTATASDEQPKRAPENRPHAGEHPAAVDYQTLTPTAPYYFFVPGRTARCEEYQQGTCITQVMPRHWSTVVTARDRFVVDLDRQSLARRINEFADLAIDDQEIRQKYFGRTRSARYPSGDTRSWQLAEARRQLQRELPIETRIQRCLYRPFDLRWIYWSDVMIDWPRTGLASQLELAGNIALIARRQSPPGRPSDFFWVTQTVALDGILRSDNRGNETVFPLFLADLPTPHVCEFDAPPRCVNISRHFLDMACNRWNLRPADTAESDRSTSLGPQDLFYYIYGLFHSSCYRHRYASQLWISFPRVFLSNHRDLAREIIEAGKGLCQLHVAPLPCADGPEQVPQADGPQIAAGYPKYRDHKVWINSAMPLTRVEPDVWNYRVGTHQVCRKWLADRRGRALPPSDVDQYAEIVRRIEATLRIRRTIDSAINEAGGWEPAFLLPSSA